VTGPHGTAGKVGEIFSITEVPAGPVGLGLQLLAGREASESDVELVRVAPGGQFHQSCDFPGRRVLAHRASAGKLAWDASHAECRRWMW